MPSDPWFESAACIGKPVEWFFPDDDAHFVDGMKVCANCQVRDECLAFCLRVEKDLSFCYGLFGGKTPFERRKLLDKKMKI